MSYHTHTSLLVHYVFSTKHRLPLIPVAMQPRLWAYVGGIARTNDNEGASRRWEPDHLHVLLSLPPDITVSKAMQLVKASSSKWMHEQQRTRFHHPNTRERVGDPGREWQVGYGAFTIGISQIKRTVDYILNQQKHHTKGASSRIEDVLEAPRAGRLRRLNSAVPDGTRVRFSS